MIVGGILFAILTVGVMCVSVILSNRQVSESDTESRVKDERSRTNKRPGESTGYSRLSEKQK